VNKVNSLSDVSYAYRYKKIEINIWMGKGTHFYFSCMQDSKTYSDDFTDFCNEGIPSLRVSYPVTDTVTLVVRPLDCREKL